jgi:hypothetical protein
MESEGQSSSTGTPVSELEIDTTLVYHLLADQHPDLMHLPIHFVAAGWDNAMFRLGDRFSVRLPRRKVAATLIENEQTWLPLLADRLSLPVPTPYRIGKPALDYPWRWSVLPWLPGRSADRDEPHANQARPFASFLRSLHMPAPFNAPQNAVRGVPLKVILPQTWLQYGFFSPIEMHANKRSQNMQMCLTPHDNVLWDGRYFLV